jgi:hypothetical protein
MIISDSRRFVFFHIPKTAGTSVRVALKPYDDGVGWARGIGKHQTPAEFLAANHDAGDLGDYFTFAFARNPWDRLVSFYHYLKPRKHVPITLPETFSGFVEALERREPWLMQFNTMRAQVDYLACAAPPFVIDFMGRFENLVNDLSTIGDRIGVTLDIGHLNRTGRGDYRGYYDVAGRDVVAAAYADDVERFGYRF